MTPDLVADASFKTAKELRQILKEHNVPIEKNSKKDDLWRLCLENNLVSTEFEEKLHITVVKMSLMNALNMTSDDKKQFIARVEEYVQIISKLLRRSSLIFHFHIIRIFNAGQDIPNYYGSEKINNVSRDTYWKRWLTIGLDDGKFPDDESKASYALISDKFNDVEELKTKIKETKFFDQVLNYAGHTFYTAIENNSWYPSFSKLERLVKMKNRNVWQSEDLKAYEIMNQIRSEAEKLDNTIEPQIMEFIQHTKQLLKATDNVEYIGDNHIKENMTFHEAFTFNMWMQKEFNIMEKKQNIMSPIFNVHRAHVRLDMKTLGFIIRDMFPTSKAVIKYKNEEKEYKAFLEQDETNGKTKCPHKQMLKSIPKPKTLKKKDCTEEVWKQFQQDKKSYEKRVQAAKESDIYVQREEMHKKNDDDFKKMIGSFFKRTRKENKFTCDYSISTDGVSVSLQYSKKVIVEKKPAPKKQELEIVQEYTKNLSSFIREINTLVIGLDPGRTNLAALSYKWYKDDGTVEKKYWRLTRNQYYSESGISKESKKKAIKYLNLREQWSQLGSLRVLSENDVVKYIENYNEIKDQWWALALDKEESVRKLKIYGGKRRCLDKFFMKIKTDVKEKHPEVNILISYGSAHKSMKPNGFGEKSAPVSATYRSCNRILNTQVENEKCSTKYNWESGNETRKVYKRFREQEGKVLESLYNCHSKQQSPRVKNEDLELVKAYYEKKKRKKRKPPDDEEEKILHYPVIRGLRFCTESRNYLDRDRYASLNIGRLTVMRLTSRSRPEIFT